MYPGGFPVPPRAAVHRWRRRVHHRRLRRLVQPAAPHAPTRTHSTRRSRGPLLFRTRDRPTGRLTEPRGCMKPGRLQTHSAGTRHNEVEESHDELVHHVPGLDRVHSVSSQTGGNYSRNSSRPWAIGCSRRSGRCTASASTIGGTGQHLVHDNPLSERRNRSTRHARTRKLAERIKTQRIGS